MPHDLSSIGRNLATDSCQYIPLGTLQSGASLKVGSEMEGDFHAAASFSPRTIHANVQQPWGERRFPMRTWHQTGGDESESLDALPAYALVRFLSDHPCAKGYATFSAPRLAHGVYRMLSRLSSTCCEFSVNTCCFRTFFSVFITDSIEFSTKLHIALLAYCTERILH